MFNFGWLFKKPTVNNSKPAVDMQLKRQNSSKKDQLNKFDANLLSKGNVVKPTTKVFDPMAFDLDEITKELNHQEVKVNTTNSKETKFNSHNTDSLNTNQLTDYSKLFQVEMEIIKLLDPKFARTETVLPIDKNGELITIVCASKSSPRKVEFALKDKNLKFRFLFAEHAPLAAAIELLYSSPEFTKQEAKERYTLINKQVKQIQVENRKNPPLILTDSPKFNNIDSSIRVLVGNLLCDAFSLGATDADFDFLELKEDGQAKFFLVFRIDIDGELTEYYREEMDEAHYERLTQVLKILAGVNTMHASEAASGVIRPLLLVNSKASPSAVELRANFIPTGESRVVSVSIRIQRKDTFDFTLSNLGFLAHQELLFRDQIMSQTDGLVIFCGPVNKGKNCSMVCLIKELMKEYPLKKVITIEDPIEITIHGATQFSCKGDKDFAFYLNHSKRHNPDIISFSETRNEVQAQKAIEAASIGHLILTTMHTKNSVSAIDQLRYFGVEDYKISETLRTVVSQRLVKRICSECVLVDDDEIPKIPLINSYIKQIGWEKEPRFLKGSGKDSTGNICGLCNGRGYHGRFAIFEVLQVTSKIRELIHQGATPQAIRAEAFRQGFQTMWQVGLRRVLQGETTLSQIVYWLGKPEPVEEGLAEEIPEIYLLDSQLDESLAS